MAGRIWTVAFEQAHTVELVHGAQAGQATVLMDGAPVDLAGGVVRKPDGGWVYGFKIAGRPVEAHAEPVGGGRWHYRLKAAGDWLDPPAPPKKLPPWSLLFVAAACLPALRATLDDPSPLALGLCWSLALGASAAILADARDPALALDRKLFKCGLLAAFVWGLLALPGFLLLGTARLLNG